MKRYLRDTTIHGFRHLLRQGKGESDAWRLAWAVVIALSFGGSGFIVASFLRDHNQNPMVTTIDFVPIQGSERNSECGL